MGQHLTDWGLPSLRWAVADQRDCKDLSHYQRQPVVPKAMPICLYFLTCNCCFPCLYCYEQGHWSDLSRAHAWAKCMEILGCPVIRIPSQPHQWGRKESRAVHLASIWLHKLPEGNQSWQSNHLRGPTPGFPWGLLLKPFPWLDVAARQQWFEIRVFPLLDGLPFQANKLHLPTATGFEVPDTWLCPFSCQ